MKINHKKAVFLCQITENNLKVVKCLIGSNSRKEFVAAEYEAIPADADEKKISLLLAKIFNKLGYANNSVVLSLPRVQATCRYIKIPSRLPQEIEKIVKLQASSYLPYATDELITGYKVVRVDKEGYSDINLIIAHKDAIERYLHIFRELRITKVNIILSSYGILDFFKQGLPDEQGFLMLIDIDYPQVELAIAAYGELFFSRSFKINRGLPGWENLLAEEINKTKDVFLKEVIKEPPAKAFILGADNGAKELSITLSKLLGLPVELLSYDKRMGLSEGLSKSIFNPEISFVSLFGLGLEDNPDSLNLMPQNIKDENTDKSLRKERLRLGLLIGGAILIFGLGVAKNLDTKARYLRSLNLEMEKIAKDARPLEDIEKRFKLLKSRQLKKPSCLDILHELHRIIPEQISLASFIYDDGAQVVLRGQADDLNYVFSFVTELEGSGLLKTFNVKVRYASQKKTQSGEFVDFEIVCLRR